MPSPTYTEQDGLFFNIEGRVQECRKASYPTGEALEEWKIFNLILNKLGISSIYKDHDSIRKAALDKILDYTGLENLPKYSDVIKIERNNNFLNETLKIKEIDYFYTNAIARSSKTMSECRAIKKQELKEGTNS